MKTAAPFLLVLALTRCDVSLTVPSGVEILCATDDECPAAMVCRAERCLREVELDRTPPTLVSVAVAGPQALVLAFSERIERAEAEDLASYTVAPPLAFTGATLGSEGQTVVIGVQRQTGATTYTLRAAGIRDAFGNVIAPPNDTATFQGVAPTIDTTPPEPLLPVMNERLVGVTQVTLQWSARSGAAAYTVDVAYDNSFTAPVPGSPFAVTPAIAGGNPESSLRIDVPTDRTYFWRVRADTTMGTSIVSDFDVVGDSLRVYCEAAVQCLDTGSAGNVTRPYRTIAGALANAVLDGITRVDVAGRDAGASYDEIVTLVDGVSLYGGYDPNFDEATRGGTETRIRGETPFTLYGEDITRLTVVDGFHIVAGIDSSEHLVKLVRADGVMLANDHIDGLESGDGDGGSPIPVSITNSGNGGGIIPAIVGCQITTTELLGGVVRGVEATDSQLRISESTIEAVGAAEATGVHVRGTLFMQDSTVISGPAENDSTGLWLDLTPPATKPSRIERSRIQAMDAPTTSSGLRLTEGQAQPAPIIVNNAIMAGVSARSVGADISRGVFVNNTVTVYDCVGVACRRYPLFAHGEPSTQSLVANNILFGQGDETRGACLGVSSFALEPQVPARIEHNLLFDCPGGAFVEIVQGGGASPLYSQLSDIQAVNTPASYVVSGRPAPVSATGNINDDAAETYFADSIGGDFTLDDDVTSAIAAGGLDASGALYGTVSVDAVMAQRTCPTPLVDCYSIGAYERD